MFMVDEEENLEKFLRQQYPGGFVGWDGYQTNIMVINRPSEGINMIIYSLISKKNEIVKVFVIDPFTNNVRMGGEELAKDMAKRLNIRPMGS